MIKDKNISLSPEILLEIEAALNYPHFYKTPVGATLNDVLVVALCNAKRTWSWRAIIGDYARYLYQYFHQPFTASKDFTHYKDRIVFTWLFDRSDLKAFVTPLLKNYKLDESVVLAPLFSMQAQLPDQTAFVVWDEFPKIDMKEWRSEFSRCLPVWELRLTKVLKAHSVPQYVARFLLRHLQLQTQRVMSSILFLEQVTPKIIVTEYDRNAQASCLILAANLRGIPSITMVHSSVMETYPSYGLAPLLANYVCCWGEGHRQKFISYGVANHDQLVVTGCQGITRSLDAEKESSCLKVGLSTLRPVVLLATSPIKLEDRMHYAWLFCRAMSGLPEVSAIVRLHPAENISEYKGLASEFKNITFFSNNSMTRDESLIVSDIIVNHESSFGTDALLKGKLVVILDVLKTPLNIGRQLIEFAGCPSAKSADELESVIRKIIVDDDWKKTLHEKAEQYALQYCESYGQEAVENICQVINNAIDSHQQRAV